MSKSIPLPCKKFKLIDKVQASNLKITNPCEPFKKYRFHQFDAPSNEKRFFPVITKIRFSTALQTFSLYKQIKVVSSDGFFSAHSTTLYALIQLSSIWSCCNQAIFFFVHNSQWKCSEEIIQLQDFFPIRLTNNILLSIAMAWSRRSICSGNKFIILSCRCF